MNSYADWLIPSCIGFAFTVLGVLQLFGLYRNRMAGRPKPVTEQPCDT
jgi:hypothetical protein